MCRIHIHKQMEKSMLKQMRNSTLLRYFVVMAFVFFLLPLHPNSAYAESEWEYLLVPVIVIGFPYLIISVGKVFEGDVGDEDKHAFGDDSNEQHLVADKDDKEKALAAKFAELNTDKAGVTYPKGRVTYPVFDW